MSTNPFPDCSFTVDIGLSQNELLEALATGTKSTKKGLVEDAIHYLLRREEEGLFDGKLSVEDALEFDLNSKRELSHQIQQSLQQTERLLNQQKATILILEQLLLRASGGNHNSTLL